MSGKGKYTQYVPAKSLKRAFLERLFKGSPFADMDEQTAAADASARGNKYLIPAHAEGNPQFFPQGVSMRFQHPNSPDFKDVKWRRAGDPASPYFPDITSPGPGPDGSVNLAPNDVDPEISIEDVNPNYIPGTPGTYATDGGGTVNPADTIPKVADGAAIGADIELGRAYKAR